LHYTLLINREAVLKLIPESAKAFPLNNLEKIEDSVMLGTVLMMSKRVQRVLPHSKKYVVGDEEAKRPKLIELAPARYQFMTASGLFMFMSKTGGAKQALYLTIAVCLAFFFLLFRVWPEWLRLGVFYVSWYLLVAIVSEAD